MIEQRERFWRAFEAVGACCSWHIDASSEGCKIDISGLPVLLAFDETRHTFCNVRGPYDLDEEILRAADAWEQACYPERGVRWI